MQAAAQQILRALRGRRSQKAFALRLGYRGNPITDWEHGRRYPTARETLRAASLVKIDVAEAFHRFQPSLVLRSDEEHFEIGRWLMELSPSLSVTDLAKRSAHSRSSVSRWLSGKAHPRLPEFLELVDAATGRVPDLVAELVPINSVPALQSRYEAGVAAKRVAFDQPWTEAVMRALEILVGLPGAQADSAGVAALLGLPEAGVAQCLALLERAALVQPLGAGAFRANQELTVDTRGGKEALYTLKAHWSRVAAQRALAPEPEDLFAYNVFSASRSDLERIRQQLRATFRQTRSTIAESSPCEEVALMNVQLMRWSPKES